MKISFSLVHLALKETTQSLSTEVKLTGGKAKETSINDAKTTTREAKKEIGMDHSLVIVVTCTEPLLSKVCKILGHKKVETVMKRKMWLENYEDNTHCPRFCISNGGITGFSLLLWRIDKSQNTRRQVEFLHPMFQS
ncbi:Nudix hydrolase 15 [Forsythia ovata]|uniref:Nudix hydrolase 15 n=1 Tax=Forsythia ovata TaxID=205694 RepID=A0ABD1XBX9_9LAMI